LQSTERQLNQKIFPFLYPPPSLLMFWPLSWFPYGEALTLQLSVNHLCFLLVLYLLWGKILAGYLVPPDDKNLSDSFAPLVLPLWVVYSLQFHPVALTIDHGQINLIALAFICLFWLGLQNNWRPAFIALPLAGAILLKTYPALFIPLLLIRRRFAIASWTSGILAGAVGLSFALLPLQTWRDWFTLVLPTGGYTNTPYKLFSPAMPWNQGINGFCSRLFLHPGYAVFGAPNFARILAYATALVVVAALVWVIWKPIRTLPGTFLPEEFGFTLLSIFLIAPLSWEHHLVFILPACLLVIGHLASGRGPALPAVLAIASVMIIGWPLKFLFNIENQGILNLLVSLKFFAVVGLWIYFLRDLRRVHAR